MRQRLQNVTITRILNINCSFFLKHQCKPVSNTEYINYSSWVVHFPIYSRPSESVVVRHLHEIWPVCISFIIIIQIAASCNTFNFTTLYSPLVLCVTWRSSPHGPCDTPRAPRPQGHSVALVTLVKQRPLRGSFGLLRHNSALYTS